MRCPVSLSLVVFLCFCVDVASMEATVSLIGGKEKASRAASCDTMGLCLVPVGWINRIYLINFMI